MDEFQWTDRPLAPGGRIEAPGVTVSALPPAGAALVSGDLDAALATLAPEAEVLGFGAIIGVEPALVRVARDRALLVTEEPLGAVSGWHGTFALTPSDDAYAALAITGAGAERLMRAGAAIDTLASSPSAACLFAGMECLVLRQQDGWRVMCPRPMATAVATWAERTARALA